MLETRFSGRKGKENYDFDYYKVDLEKHKKKDGDDRNYYIVSGDFFLCLFK
jgi:hypothetical protein